MRDEAKALARDMIMSFEGVVLTAYQDSAEVWTIGYGHTGPDVKRGMTITRERAVDLLTDDMNAAISGVYRLVKVPLTDGQAAALVDFTFNLGVGALQRSTLLSVLNAGHYDAVPDQLRLWNKAGGKVLPGLTRRREAECAMWNRPDPVAAPLDPGTTVAPAPSNVAPTQPPPSSGGFLAWLRSLFA